MKELTSMGNNHYTVKLLDLKLIKQSDSQNVTGLFIVMEYIESDLKKIMNQGLQTNLTEEHLL